MKQFLSRGLAAALVAGALATSITAMAQQPSTPLLFKIVTTRDEVIVAVPPNEAGAPRAEAGAIGQALVAKGALTLWQYVTQKGADGALEMAPRAKVSVLAHDSLRVEPYTPAVRVIPMQ
jgi:hypothetical protein